MALLRVDTAGKPNILKVELDGNTNTRLRRYSRYTNNGTIQSIVKAALTYCFDADKDFLEWEKHPENQQEPERGRRKKRGASAPPEGGAAANASPSASTIKK